MNLGVMRWKKRKQKGGGPLAWAASALPLSHDSWTATNPPPLKKILYLSCTGGTDCFSPHLAATQYVPSELHWGLTGEFSKEPMLSDFVHSRCFEHLTNAGNRINIFRCYEAESEKDDMYSHQESNSGHVWLELPLNPKILYICSACTCRWYWITHLAATQ